MELSLPGAKVLKSKCSIISTRQLHVKITLNNALDTVPSRWYRNLAGYGTVLSSLDGTVPSRLDGTVAARLRCRQHNLVLAISN